ncbi:MULTISPECIES: YtxH domain-containing protein [Amphibacillus]|uniref:YtxH domain-containing protein n=1 Tax=Amphibacillus TaxID=29331 RepID=UPI0002F0DCF2|nr:MULTISPECIES: YtxH domain-containing protein [Amphibacillus]MBM7541505.1 gas vesicle protein [Amphibacillus cookii]
MTNSKSLLLGILAGGVVSAAATLLSAPKSGQETREDIKNHAESVKHSLEKVKVSGKVLSDQIINTSKEGAALIKELSADMKHSVESWKNTIEPHQKNIQLYLTQIEDRLKELEEQTQATEQ